MYFFIIGDFGIAVDRVQLGLSDVRLRLGFRVEPQDSVASRLYGLNVLQDILYNSRDRTFPT